MSRFKYNINLKKVLLITVIPLLFASTCKKDGTNPCVNTAYSFAVTAEFSPQREIYNVGDTIFLTSSFSKTLIDLAGNYNVDYSNSVGIGGNLFTAYLDTINKQVVDALNKFEALALKGSTSPLTINSNGGVNVYFSESSNYELKIGIVLKAKGIFRFGLSNLASQGIKGKNCTNAGFSMTVINTNKNLNLFNYAIGYYPDALAEKTIYCFRVQ